MSVSKKTFPAIPATKHGFLLSGNIFYPTKEDPYAMVPSKMIKIPHSFAEIEWPELKEVEGGYPGEYAMELKKRKVIRIYCKHQAKYNTQKPKKEEGQGTFDSPFVCLWSALEHSACFLGSSCFFVQILIMDESEVINPNYAIDTAVYGGYRLMISGDNKEFTYNCTRDTQFHLQGTIIQKCKFISGALDIYRCDWFHSTIHGRLGATRHIINCSVYPLVSDTYVTIGSLSSDMVLYGTTLKNVEILRGDICKCTGENIFTSSYDCNVAHSSITDSPHRELRYAEFFGFFHTLLCSFVTNSTLNNYNVNCQHLISSTLSSSTIDFKLYSIGGLHVGCTVEKTLSESKIKYSFVARPIAFASAQYPVAFRAIGVNVGKGCVLNNAECTLSVAVKDPTETDADASAGAGCYVVCDLAQDSRKCISGCRSGSYNFANDEDFDPSGFKVDCNNI